MKKRGRPPKNPEDMLTESVMFMMLPSEKAAYVAAAIADGCTLSQWIREILNKAAKKSSATQK